MADYLTDLQMVMSNSTEIEDSLRKLFGLGSDLGLGAIIGELNEKLSKRTISDLWVINNERKVFAHKHDSVLKNKPRFEQAVKNVFDELATVSNLLDKNVTVKRRYELLVNIHRVWTETAEQKWRILSQIMVSGGERKKLKAYSLFAMQEFKDSEPSKPKIEPIIGNRVENISQEGQLAKVRRLKPSNNRALFTDFAFELPFSALGPCREQWSELYRNGYTVPCACILVIDPRSGKKLDKSKYVTLKVAPPIEKLRQEIAEEEKKKVENDRARSAAAKERRKIQKKTEKEKARKERRKQRKIAQQEGGKG